MKADIINYLTKNASVLGIATIFKLLKKIDFPEENIMFISDTVFSSQKTLINSIAFLQEKVMIKINMGLLALQSPLLKLLLIDETYNYERELQLAINQYLTVAIKLLYIDLVKESSSVYQDTCLYFDIPKFSLSIINTITSYALAKYRCKVSMENNMGSKVFPTFLGKSELNREQGITYHSDRIKQTITINIYSDFLLTNEETTEIIETIKKRLITQYYNSLCEYQCRLLIVNHYEHASNEKYILPSAFDAEKKMIKETQVIYKEDFYGE